MSKTSLDFHFKFKDELNEERRHAESARILSKYPNRVPVVIEKSGADKMLPDIDQSKFLIPTDFSFLKFQSIIRKRLELAPEKAMYIIFRGNKIFQGDKLMGKIYEESKDPDNFIYCKYSTENFAG